MTNLDTTATTDYLFVLIGSGRLAHQVAEIMKRIENLQRFRFLSYCRHASESERTPFERILRLPDNFAFAAAIGNPHLRGQEVNAILSNRGSGSYVESIISPEAHIEKSADTKTDGALIILPGAIVSSGCQLGEHTIIGSGAILEHDSVVGKFSTIGPGSVICGSAMIGNHAFIGANSTVIQKIKIGSSSVIGAGSVVIRDIESNSLALGNPCRIVRKLGDTHQYI
jgi:acetyltransferase EpsM